MIAITVSRFRISMKAQGLEVGKRGVTSEGVIGRDEAVIITSGEDCVTAHIEDSVHIVVTGEQSLISAP